MEAFDSHMVSVLLNPGFKNEQVSPGQVKATRDRLEMEGLQINDLRILYSPYVRLADNSIPRK